jgi:hypothetical protein
MIYPDAPLRRSRWMITGRNARGLFEWVPTRVKCLPYPYSECSFPQGKFFRDRRISGGACKRTPEAVALAAPRVGCESRREAPENSARWATDAWPARRMRARIQSHARHEDAALHASTAGVSLTSTPRIGSSMWGKGGTCSFS